MIVSMTLNDLAQDVGYIAPSSTACGRSDKIGAGVSEDLPEEALAALTAAPVGLTSASQVARGSHSLAFSLGSG